jgi:hypothetical protein
METREDPLPEGDAVTVGGDLVAPPSEVAEAAGDRRWPRPGWFVAAGYLLGALWVYGRFWPGLDHRYLTDSGQDQTQWEWFFAVTAHNVTHLHDPFFTTLLNHPLGVNLMANTVMLGLAVPLTPVTLLFGPTVTWALILTLGLAATATAWYGLLRRHVVRSWPAAALGGGFAAFAPPVISHANAHPNLAVLFVIPLIIDRLLRLTTGDAVVRDGVILGLLVTFQILLGEEPLLLAATGLAVFALGYGLARPDRVRSAVPLAKGFAVAAVVSAPLVAYPLWWQFFGPQSYRSLLHGPAGNDVLALTGFASRSLAGDRATAGPLSLNPTEQNAFFGWPLLILVAVLVVWLRRVALVRALTLVIVVAATFSLGPEIMFRGENTGLAGPWKLISQLPLYESVLETRFTMVCVPAIAILLAFATEQVVTLGALAPWRGAPLRLVWGVALAEALLPIAPKPLLAADRPATPAFFSRGLWRQYAAPGHTIVTVPLPDSGAATAMHWQVVAGLRFSIAEGYFLGPWGSDRQGVYGAVPRPTSSLLAHVRDGHVAAAVTPADVQAARDDLVFWQADAVVLGPHDQQEPLRVTLDRLLGPGAYVGGVWVWDVRSITHARGGD